jgi:hypothetical protein
MNAIGLCSHNNNANYCPFCQQQEAEMNGIGRLGSYSDFAGGMGACPEGYYELEIFGVKSGQCVPNLRTITEGAQSGVMQSVGTGVAQSPATQTAATTAAGNALGQKIFNFYKEKPMVAWGLTAGVALFVVYGGMSFLRGR